MVSIPQAVSTVATEVRSLKNGETIAVVSIPQAVSTVATLISRIGADPVFVQFQYRKR